MAAVFFSGPFLHTVYYMMLCGGVCMCVGVCMAPGCCMSLAYVFVHDIGVCVAGSSVGKGVT